MAAASANAARTKFMLGLNSVRARLILAMPVVGDPVPDPSELADSDDISLGSGAGVRFMLIDQPAQQCE